MDPEEMKRHARACVEASISLARDPEQSLPPDPCGRQKQPIVTDPRQRQIEQYKLALLTMELYRQVGLLTDQEVLDYKLRLPRLE